jgi:hypothetical protein
MTRKLSVSFCGAVRPYINLYMRNLNWYSDLSFRQNFGNISSDFHLLFSASDLFSTSESNFLHLNLHEKSECNKVQYYVYKLKFWVSLPKSAQKSTDLFARYSFRILTLPKPLPVHFMFQSKITSNIWNLQISWLSQAQWFTVSSWPPMSEEALLKARLPTNSAENKSNRMNDSLFHLE